MSNYASTILRVVFLVTHSSVSVRSQKSYAVDPTWTAAIPTLADDEVYCGPPLAAEQFCWEEVPPNTIYVNTGYALRDGVVSMFQFYSRPRTETLVPNMPSIAFFILSLVSNSTAQYGPGRGVFSYAFNVSYASTIQIRNVIGYHSVAVTDGPTVKNGSFLGWAFPDGRKAICYGTRESQPQSNVVSLASPKPVALGDILVFTSNATNAEDAYAAGVVLTRRFMQGTTARAPVVEATYIRFNIADSTTWPPWFLPAMICGAVVVAVAITVVLIKILRCNAEENRSEEANLARAISQTIVAKLGAPEQQRQLPSAVTSKTGIESSAASDKGGAASPATGNVASPASPAQQQANKPAADEGSSVSTPSRNTAPNARRTASSRKAK